MSVVITGQREWEIDESYREVVEMIGRAHRNGDPAVELVSRGIPVLVFIRHITAMRDHAPAVPFRGAVG